MDDLISRQAAIDALMNDSDWADAIPTIKSLPSANPRTEGVLCALADRACPFQGKEFAWCLTCPHISEEDRELVKKVASEPKTGEWIDYVGKDLGIEGQWLRDDGKTVFVQCDQCDSIFVRNLMTHMNYCPNCGAKMYKDGEDE